MMHQESFERGMKIGLGGALVVVRRSPATAEAEILGLIEEVNEAMARHGYAPRVMVADDIFLPMPMATAADFGIETRS